MNITYRELGPEDSTSYRNIRLESLRLHPESFGSTFEEQSKLPKLMFEKAIEQPYDDRFVIGAFDQQALVGICGFIPFVPDNNHHFSNTGSIIQVYVRSEYGGRKIGLSLVNATIREAFRLADIDQIVLGVLKGNLSAIRIYEQAGFVTYDLEGNETGDNTRFMIIRRDGCTN